MSYVTDYLVQMVHPPYPTPVKLTLRIDRLRRRPSVPTIDAVRDQLSSTVSAAWLILNCRSREEACAAVIAHLRKAPTGDCIVKPLLG